MGVPVFTVVNVGLAMTFLGGGLLLLVAALVVAGPATGSRSRASAGRRPRASAALAGWLLWVGGIAVQVLGQFGMVGVARW